MESLKQMMVQKEATLIAREEQLTQDLEVSHANEQHAKDTIQKLEAEISQLRLSLCNTESRAEALASECQRVCSVHWEAQAQLIKLHSVLQYMLCNSPEPKLREHGDQNLWSSSFLNRGKSEEQVNDQYVFYKSFFNQISQSELCCSRTIFGRGGCMYLSM